MKLVHGKVLIQTRTRCIGIAGILQNSTVLTDSILWSRTCVCYACIDVELIICIAGPALFRYRPVFSVSHADVFEAGRTTAGQLI